MRSDGAAIMLAMFSAVQWHLMLNHLPVAGCLFALLLFLAAAILNQRVLYCAACALLLLSALLTLPVYFTGQEAVPTVEALDPSAEPLLATHGLMGRFALNFMLLAGAAAVVLLVREWRRFNDPVRLASLLAIGALLLACAFMAYVAHTGGLVRHPEIRPPAQAEP